MPVNITVAELANNVRVSGDSETDILTRLLSVATAFISQVAPTAPTAIMNEAAVRLVGYLYDQPTMAAGMTYANAWRNSGAAAIVYPWKEIGIGADVEALIPTVPSTPSGGGDEIVPDPPATGEYVLTAENGVLEWIVFPRP